MSVFLVKGRRRWLRFFWRPDRMEVHADTYEEAGIIAGRCGLMPPKNSSGENEHPIQLIAKEGV